MRDGGWNGTSSTGMEPGPTEQISARITGGRHHQSSLISYEIRPRIVLEQQSGASLMK
ncbi:hypothetical protein QBC32DRAFT_167260 [Pseudoneurospora amorphoporcata]|uniref:Uncharacterized protein n=1 Tax=Pseudoneurospora amorphoporcata TaxID=241081 RepID=A0AAN6SEG1_9PEZI|nr:hypothetical protein QBC32DRAFT_167260 [Pseudoneurospora amorphoporcata]